MIRTEGAQPHRLTPLAGQGLHGAGEPDSEERFAALTSQVYEEIHVVTREAVEACATLAGWLECRGDEVSASLFRDLLRREAALACDASYRLPSEEEATAGAEPGEHSWLYTRRIEAGADEFVAHLMTGWHALNIALAAKIRAKRFLEGLARSTDDPRARAVLLMRMREEGEQIRLLSTALERTPRAPVSEEDWEGLAGLAHER